jgi:ATP-binding cassette subfamily C protein CydC
LLTRAWDPQHGEILINEQPISALSETTLRQSISVVPQRVHLFSATLRDNLLLAAPHASDDIIRDAVPRRSGQTA